MTGRNFPWHDLSRQHAFCPAAIIYSMTGCLRIKLPGQNNYICFIFSAMLQLTVSATSPMVCYITLYWFQRRPLNLLPWYVILHCIGFREGPSTSSHGTLSYIVLVSEKAPQPPPMVCYLSLYWFQRRPLNLLPW